MPPKEGETDKGRDGSFSMFHSAERCQLQWTPALSHLHVEKCLLYIYRLFVLLNVRIVFLPHLNDWLIKTKFVLHHYVFKDNSAEILSSSNPMKTNKHSMDLLTSSSTKHITVAQSGMFLHQHKHAESLIFLWQD